jgi:putative redox protein
MITSEVEYLGNLRTKCTHLQSGTIVLTDAPIDNNGKGEAFSPTDLVATSYASCMITIMGIYCAQQEINFVYAKASVTKIMESAPRRIGKILIEMDLSNNGWTNEEFEKVVRAGKACPVAKTVSENVEIEFTFLLN